MLKWGFIEYWVNQRSLWCLILSGRATASNRTAPFETTTYIRIESLVPRFVLEQYLWNPKIPKIYFFFINLLLFRHLDQIRIKQHIIKQCIIKQHIIKAPHYKTTDNNTGYNKTSHNKTRQNKRALNKTIDTETAHNKTTLNRTQNNTE